MWAGIRNDRQETQFEKGTATIEYSYHTMYGLVNKLCKNTLYL